MSKDDTLLLSCLYCQSVQTCSLVCNKSERSIKASRLSSTSRPSAARLKSFSASSPTDPSLFCRPWESRRRSGHSPLKQTRDYYWTLKASRKTIFFASPGRKFFETFPNILSIFTFGLHHQSQTRDETCILYMTTLILGVLQMLYARQGASSKRHWRMPRLAVDHLDHQSCAGLLLRPVSLPQHSVAADGFSDHQTYSADDLKQL